ncbi:hypothetical protein BDW66DRAFT_55269 [Aspergillus desertorum]
MPKLLQKIKDIMASCHGPESKNCGDEQDAYTADDSGGKAHYFPYHFDDYGLRFGSCENKLRPGTYGSGSYGPNNRAKGYGSSSNAGTHFFYAESQAGPGFSSDAGGSSSYNRGSGCRNSWPYGHGSRGKTGFMPIDRGQRSNW